MPTLLRHHPDGLPTFKWVILAIISLGVMTAGEPIFFLIPVVFGIYVIWQVSTWQVALFVGLELLVCFGFDGSEGLLVHAVSKATGIRFAIALVSATVCGTLVGKFLRGIEWELASRAVLSALTDADTAATPEMLIEQAVTLLRDLSHADAAVALRQLDDVTAEALVLLPANALPDKITTPKLFELALAKNCCLYYPNYASFPDAAPILVAQGAQSLAVLPLQLPPADLEWENSAEVSKIVDHHQQLDNSLSSDFNNTYGEEYIFPTDGFLSDSKPAAPSNAKTAAKSKIGGAILLIWYRRTDIPSHLQRFIESLLGELRTLLRFQHTNLSLDELRVRYRAILETIPQGVIFVDESGEHGWINQAAAEQLELKQGALEPLLISQAMAKLRMSADNQEKIVAQAAQFFSQSQAEIRDWCWVLSGDKPKVLSIASTPTRVRDVPGRLWLLDNITDKYFAQQALKERTAQLEATNKELETFSYSVSHDLRAPLRRINSFSQILLKDYSDKLDEQGKNYFQRICIAAEQMGQLIEETLQLARVSKSEIRCMRVNLSDLAGAIAQDLQQVQPERQVEFVIAPNIIAYADPRLIQVVLENLLGNAWKYTGKHQSAHIEFGVTQHNNKVAYFVSDDGAGFDMTYAHKLFVVFQRLHDPTEFEGSGVGLATVQRIIHRHGGRIWAEAVKDQGATFYFTL